MWSVTECKIVLYLQHGSGFAYLTSSPFHCMLLNRNCLYEILQSWMNVSSVWFMEDSYIIYILQQNIKITTNLMFMWPCILINSYNKTKKMHQFLKSILGLKLYTFRTVPLSSIRSFPLYAQQWYMSYSFADNLRAGSGWNTLILLASCLLNCMTYTTAVCRVKNSWWWTQELSETHRVSFQE
jgi:hypothetical protein